MTRVTGAEAIVSVLESEGLSYLFGNPGTTEGPMLDALVGNPRVQYVMGLHDNIAVAMAGGFAAATGKPGVVSLHTSLGTASGFLGIVSAYNEGLPLVVIAGQQHTKMLLTEPSLTFDLHGPVREFSKWMWEIRDVEEVPQALRRAVKVARELPAGPTFLILPSNVGRQEIDVGEQHPPEKYHTSPKVRGDPQSIMKAVELLVAADRPALVYGASAVRGGAVPELVELAELLSMRVFAAPRFPHLAFPTDHPLYLGIFDRAAAESIDLVFGVGLKMFREHDYVPRPFLAPNVRVIHMDLNPYEIAKNFPVDAGIIAHPKAGLRDLIDTVKSLLTDVIKNRVKQREAEVSKMKELLNETLGNEAAKDWDNVPIKPWRLVKELRRAMNRQGVVVEEAVRSTRFLERHFDIYESGTFFRSPGGLGWGLPASVGVSLGMPDRQVAAYVGDGSFMYAPQTLWTMAHYKVPVVTVVCNNKAYVSQKSFLFQLGGHAAKTGRYVGGDIVDPEIDFVRLASGLGVKGVKVEKPGDLAPRLKEAFASGEPYLLDVAIDAKEAGVGTRLPS
ncbi:MAG: thiamine pyrophosphate-binding protein [Thaumarchaeota archaeon]|nr:thiamine pyrophosphate-binding protein [Nitrososphaerota archaeon]